MLISERSCASEGTVNAVNSNHVMWVPLLIAGAGCGADEASAGVEHLISIGAMFLTKDMQERADQVIRARAVAALQHLSWRAARLGLHT